MLPVPVQFLCLMPDPILLNYIRLIKTVYRYLPPFCLACRHEVWPGVHLALLREHEQGGQGGVQRRLRPLLREEDLLHPVHHPRPRDCQPGQWMTKLGCLWIRIRMDSLSKFGQAPWFFNFEQSFFVVFFNCRTLFVRFSKLELGPDPH